MANSYIKEATALFIRLADKHGLHYQVETDAPMEVLWTLPAQARLSMPLTFGLQNGDELNFGVGDFWSYFFPFDERAAIFERVVDAWIEGRARVVHVRLGGRALQLEEDGIWKTVYRADCIFPVPRNPKRIYMNQPLPSAGAE
jgi:hypothetical protein